MFLGFVVLGLFAILQGAVIFTTAYIICKAIGNVWSKFSFMAVSYCGWVLVTIVGYSSLGGDGGLFDGFGMVLVLCFTALLSSIGYLALWNAKT